MPAAATKTVATPARTGCLRVAPLLWGEVLGWVELNGLIVVWLMLVIFDIVDVLSQVVCRRTTGPAGYRSGLLSRSPLAGRRTHFSRTEACRFPVCSSGLPVPPPHWSDPSGGAVTRQLPVEQRRTDRPPRP